MIASTRQPTILQKLFGVDQLTSPFYRDETNLYDQRTNSSKIIANLTTQSADEQTRYSSPPLMSSEHKLQTQLSVQDTVQRHFCQILKNNSLTVTDKTTMTEKLLMRENSSSTALSEYSRFPFYFSFEQNLLVLDGTQLTPPMSNDDENKRPSHSKSKSASEKEKKSNSRPVQYRILQRGQTDDISLLKNKSLPDDNDLNPADTSTPTSKSQRNRRKLISNENDEWNHEFHQILGRADKRLAVDANRKQSNSVQPFSNLTNNDTSPSVTAHPFRYNGPSCWKQFRLNRSEVFRCLRD